MAGAQGPQDHGLLRWLGDALHEARFAAAMAGQECHGAQRDAFRARQAGLQPDPSGQPLLPGSLEIGGLTLKGNLQLLDVFGLSECERVGIWMDLGRRSLRNGGFLNGSQSIPLRDEVLDGHYPWTIRFLDVLQHGCVPVVVSESWHPPLHRLLAWTSPSFPTILVHPRWMPILDRLLGDIPLGHYLDMQAATIHVARIFDPRYGSCPAAVLAELFLSKLEAHEERRF